MGTTTLTERETEDGTMILRELADDLGEALDLALLLHDLQAALVEEIDGIFRRQLERPLLPRTAPATAAA